MRPYIYARRNLIHIIDVRETIRGLLRCGAYLQKVAAQGSLVLMVGTKRQACDVTEQQGLRCGMPFVSDRWLGAHADELPHDPQPAHAARRLEANRIPTRFRATRRDVSCAQSRIPQDVSQPQRYSQA